MTGIPNKVCKELKIVIVGGGLGGCAVGIALLQRGFYNVCIYERDHDMHARRQGYGLTILQGISALKSLGIFDQVLEEDTPSRSHFIFDKDGKILGFFGTGLWEEAVCKAKKHNLHIQRQELRKILLEKYISLHPLKFEGIKWNHKLLNINLQERCVSFWNWPDIFDVDLVIGADGINTITRSFKYDPSTDSKLDYLGIIVVLGITGNTNHFLEHERVFQTMDGHFRFFAMPFSKTNPSQSIMWQLSFPIKLKQATEFASNPKDLKDFVLNHCKNWHEPIPTMISKTPVNLIMGIPAFDRNLDIVPSAIENNFLPITLIGDASHPMSPFKGQGANQVLLDAVDFATCLNNEFNSLQNSDSFANVKSAESSFLSNLKISSILNAINNFEQKMMQRVKIKVQQSRDRVTSFHQEHILREENFYYRGIDSSVLERAHSLGISANWDNAVVTIEDALKKILQKNSA